MDASEEPRIFTYDEATELLPVLRELLTTLQQTKEELDDLRRRLRQYTPVMKADGYAAEATELERQMQQTLLEMRGLSDQINEMGVELKDIDKGLVDFPTLREGRIVYYCWMVSESTIGYWHEVDAGYAGRQPL